MTIDHTDAGGRERPFWPAVRKKCGPFGVYILAPANEIMKIIFLWKFVAEK